MIYMVTAVAHWHIHFGMHAFNGTAVVYIAYRQAAGERTPIRFHNAPAKLTRAELVMGVSSSRTSESKIISAIDMRAPYEARDTRR